MEYTFRNGDYLRVDYDGEIHIRGNDGKFISNEVGEAIKKYTRGSKYKEIREAQQNGESEPLGETLEHYIHTSRAFQGDLYRGINTNDTYYIGQVIDMRGTSSWSESIDIAKEYSKGDKKRVVFHTRDIGVAISMASSKEREQEVLVSKEERFVVKSIVEDEYIFIELGRM